MSFVADGTLAQVLTAAAVGLAFFDWESVDDVKNACEDLMGAVDAATLLVFVSHRLDRELDFRHDIHSWFGEDNRRLQVVHMLRWSEDGVEGGFFAGFVAGSKDAELISKPPAEWSTGHFPGTHFPRTHFPLSRGPQFVTPSNTKWWFMPSQIKAWPRCDPAAVSPASHLIVYIVRCLETYRTLSAVTVLDDFHEWHCGPGVVPDTWYLPVAALASACPVVPAHRPSHILVAEVESDAGASPWREQTSARMMEVAQAATCDHVLEWLLKQRLLDPAARVVGFRRAASLAESFTDARIPGNPDFVLLTPRIEVDGGSLFASANLGAGMIVGFVEPNYIRTVDFLAARAGGGEPFPCLVVGAAVGPASCPVFQYSRMSPSDPMVLLAGTGFDKGNVTVSVEVYEDRPRYVFRTRCVIEAQQRLLLDVPAMDRICWLGAPGYEPGEWSDAACECVQI